MCLLLMTCSPCWAQVLPGLVHLGTGLKAIGGQGQAPGGTRPPGNIACDYCLGSLVLMDLWRAVLASGFFPAALGLELCFWPWLVADRKGFPRRKERLWPPPMHWARH